MGLRNRAAFNEYNIFFITTTCYKWLHLLNIADNMSFVVSSLTFCSKKYDASILGYAIMPNHLHLIVHFVDGSKRIGFMRDFKKFTAFQIRKEIEMTDTNLLEKLRYRKNKQIFKIWQDRFDELFLETKELLEQKLTYMHQNPLQEHWLLVNVPTAYKFSSASFYEDNKQSMLTVKHYANFL